MLDNKEWGRQSVVFYDVIASPESSRFDEIFYMRSLYMKFFTTALHHAGSPL